MTATLTKVLTLWLLLGVTAMPLAAADADQADADDTLPQVVLETSMGEIRMELYPDKAPATVENFLAYVDAGFYDGTIFHRVIDNFMIQGGGFTTDYQKKATRPAIRNEADNGLRNIVGTVAMARTGDPHSATAQFFINVRNNSFLDFREKTQRAWGYAVFGRVIKGMKTVAEIKQVKTGASGPFRKDAPQEPVIIHKARRLQQAAAPTTPQTEQAGATQ